MMAKETVWAGDPDLCQEAYGRSGGTVEHPLNQIDAVIAAARNSSLFNAWGYIRASNWSGTREIRRPAFKLTDEAKASYQPAACQIKKQEVAVDQRT